MGGPDPADAEEQCVVASLHIGKNRCGLNFAESYHHFDSTVVQAYAEFLDSKLHDNVPVIAASSISKKTGHDKGSNANDGADVMKGDNDDEPDDHRSMDDEDDADVGEGQEGNDAGIGKDNEGDDAGIGDNQEGDDSGIDDDQEVDNAGRLDKLSGASTLIFIFSTLRFRSCNIMLSYRLATAHSDHTSEYCKSSQNSSICCNTFTRCNARFHHGTSECCNA
ncbi:hypothetical protein M404DRAFT_36424 [Pisolithus tinctorius Marx 270]|uniref:Uncharacterized protein n=1 Tax=Pisolithus tinctorius Marx 270 TaxID=870435 RepID=A0A0C3NAZ5_PISTI|nr:hypothetical protein M404DRAFT_36424 [Pisolithus tinctorius Marx 270]